MIADVARAVPRELLNASYTLGAGRWTVAAPGDPAATRVPGIIDVARINLAAAWLMLVVAELLAAQEGLASGSSGPSASGPSTRCSPCSSCSA